MQQPALYYVNLNGTFFILVHCGADA